MCSLLLHLDQESCLFIFERFSSSINSSPKCFVIHFLVRNYLVAKNRSSFKEALIKRFFIIMQRNLSDLHCMV